METSSGTNKPWYAKPENRTGVVLGLGLTALAVWSGIHLMPYILLAATNTLYAGIAVGALALLVFAVLDKDVHNIVYYGWKMITRGLTGFIVDLDPISIIETSLKKMRSRLEEMFQSKNALNGQIKKLDSVIAENTARIEKSLKLAQQAEKVNNMMARESMAMEAKQLDASNQTLTLTRNKMMNMYQYLDRMYKSTEFILKNTEMQVDIKKRERAAIMEGHRAMTSGWKVIKGNTAEKEMFDRGMESIADTMHKQLADMEGIMNVSADILNGVDLEKMVIKEDAFKMLEKWEAQGTSAILGPDKVALVSRAYDQTSMKDATPVLVTSKTDDRFAKLLE